MIDLSKVRNYYIACGLSPSYFYPHLLKRPCVSMLFTEKMRIIFISIHTAVPVRFRRFPIRHFLLRTPLRLLTWLSASFQQKVLRIFGLFEWKNAQESQKSFQSRLRFGIAPLLWFGGTYADGLVQEGLACRTDLVCVLVNDPCDITGR